MVVPSCGVHVRGTVNDSGAVWRSNKNTGARIGGSVVETLASFSVATQEGTVGYAQVRVHGVLGKIAEVARHSVNRQRARS